MGFFGQEYWSGLPCPPTGDLSDSGIKPASLTSPALAGMFFVVVQSLSQKIKICLCDPKDCNTPGFPVLHYLPEFAQTHVHWVDDAIQPSHPLLPTSPALNFSQNQGLFQWVGSLHQVAKVLELQHQSFQWIFRIDLHYDQLVWSPCSPRDFQKSSPAPQFKSIDFSGLRLLYGPMLTSVHDYWKNHSFDYMDFCWQCDISAFKYAV